MATSARNQSNVFQRRLSLLSLVRFESGGYLEFQLFMTHGTYWNPKSERGFMDRGSM